MFIGAPEYTLLMAICSVTDPIDRSDAVLAPAHTLMQIAKTTRGQRRKAAGPNSKKISGIGSYVRLSCLFLGPILRVCDALNSRNQT